MTAEQHRSAAAIIHAIQHCGSDADDLRDAAHEACHALETDIPRGRWDRETIHAAIMSSYKKRSSAVTQSFQIARIVGFETTARAVERVICTKFDVDIGDPQHWANIACIEAAQGSGIRLPSAEWLLEQINKAMLTDRVQKLVAQIIALGDEPSVKPAAKKRRRT